MRRERSNAASITSGERQVFIADASFCDVRNSYGCGGGPAPALLITVPQKNWLFEISFHPGTITACWVRLTLQRKAQWLLVGHTSIHMQRCQPHRDVQPLRLVETAIRMGSRRCSRY